MLIIDLVNVQFTVQCHDCVYTCSLSVNEIGDEGVIAISSSLSTLSNLQTLRYVLIGVHSINDLKWKNAVLVKIRLVMKVLLLYLLL